MLPGFPIAISSRRARRLTEKAPRRRRARVELLESRTMLDSNPIEAPRLTPNQNYVNQLYHDLLGRAAEPAGLQYWSNMLTAGVTRTVIAEDVQASQEYRYDTLTSFTIGN